MRMVCVGEWCIPSEENHGKDLGRKCLWSMFKSQENDGRALGQRSVRLDDLVCNGNYQPQFNIEEAKTDS